MNFIKATIAVMALPLIASGLPACNSSPNVVAIEANNAKVTALAPAVAKLVAPKVSPKSGSGKASIVAGAASNPMVNEL